MPKKSDRLFPVRTNQKHRIFLKARQETRLKISLRTLREWLPAN